jgi:hypothetical protein
MISASALLDGSAGPESCPEGLQSSAYLGDRGFDSCFVKCSRVRSHELKAEIAFELSADPENLLRKSQLRRFEPRSCWPSETGNFNPVQPGSSHARATAWVQVLTGPTRAPSSGGGIHLHGHPSLRSPSIASSLVDRQGRCSLRLAACVVVQLASGGHANSHPPYSPTVVSMPRRVRFSRAA